MPSRISLSSKDISLLAVSKDADLTRALATVLRKILSEKSVAFLLLSSMPVAEFLRKSDSTDFRERIEQGDLVVVDCMSRYSSEEEKDIQELEAKTNKNIYYVSSPSDLSEVALKVSEAVSSSRPKGEKWLVLDSITTLTLYNSVGGILRFMKYLFDKFKIHDFDGAVIVVRDEASDTMIQAIK
ncbi:MAG: hypothetical protein ACREBS_00130, partial [Nitrososphaerales archaeon]